MFIEPSHQTGLTPSPPGGRIPKARQRPRQADIEAALVAEWRRDRICRCIAGLLRDRMVARTVAAHVRAARAEAEPPLNP